MIFKLENYKIIVFKTALLILFREILRNFQNVLQKNTIVLVQGENDVIKLLANSYILTTFY